MSTNFEAENPFNLVEIKTDARQQQQWTQVKAGLHWQAPWFYHIMVTMLNPRDNDTILYWTHDIPTLATDGFRIAANPDYYFKLTIGERIFAIAHEVAHGMLHHNEALYRAFVDGFVFVNGERLPFDRQIAGKAVDYPINDMLIKGNVGVFNKAWLHDTNIATEDDAWVETYYKLYKQQQRQPKPKQQQGQQGQGQPGTQPGNDDNNSLGNSRQDDHLKPGALGKDMSPEAAMAKTKAHEARWRNAVETAAKMIEGALARGQASAGLKKFFTAFLQPKLSWTDEITGTFAKKIGSGSYDYRRPDRRLVTRDIYAPSRSGHGCRTLVFGSDTSGSIFCVPDLLERFFAEMAEVMSVYKPQRAYVVWCDAEVKRAVRIDDMVDLQREWEHGAEGGGGTSFAPVFEWIEQEGLDDVDALVYLTDMDGSFPEEPPPYPTIWVSIAHDKKAPFGDIIYIPNDGTA